MWDRHPDLNINQFAWFLYHGSKILPNAERYQIITQGRDPKDVYDKSKTHLHFTKEEEEVAQKDLINMGIPSGSTFIGIISRDSKYLKATSSLDYSGHNYRDSNIEHYLLASEELVNRGHYIIRMGAKLNKTLKTKNPNIIDYATNGFRTDLLDIYIAANCHFFKIQSKVFDYYSNFRFYLLFSF